MLIMLTKKQYDPVVHPSHLDAVPAVQGWLIFDPVVHPSRLDAEPALQVHLSHLDAAYSL